MVGLLQHCHVFHKDLQITISLEIRFGSGKFTKTIVSLSLFCMLRRLLKSIDFNKHIRTQQHTAFTILMAILVNPNPKRSLPSPPGAILSRSAAAR